MPSATRTITINRPIQEVFAFLADGATARQWRSGVLDIEHVAGSGTGVGATYRQGVKGPGGRRIAADYRITASEPPTHLAFDAIAGPVRPHGEYRLERVDGGTRLTFSLAAELGLLKRLLMGRAVQRTMDAEMQATDTLKRVLEA
jgi:carbon monoxide dehydrogenase subunit G